MSEHSNAQVPLHHRVKRTVVGVLKLVLAVGLLAVLIVHAQRQDMFQRLWNQPKDWWMLCAAACCCLTAVLLTFARWYLLIRTLGLQLRLRDAVRLGFLGYALNFVSLGSVGGDLFKAVFLAHGQPGRRTEAVATVVVDRVVGLYALFLVASGAILLTGVDQRSHSEPLRVVCRSTLTATAVLTAAVVVLLSLRPREGRWTERIGRLPWMGPTLSRLLDAAAIYRRNLPTVVVAMAMSLVVHTLFVLGIYSIARALPGEAPTLADHFLVVPVSMVIGAIPVTPSGLGTLEATLAYMYTVVEAVPSSEAVSGVVVALVYRLITVIIAMIGVCFYFAGHREVQETIHEAELTEESLE